MKSNYFVMLFEKYSAPPPQIIWTKLYWPLLSCSNASTPQKNISFLLISLHKLKKKEVENSDNLFNLILTNTYRLSTNTTATNTTITTTTTDSKRDQII